MISGSPTQGTKLNEDLGKSDTMPFLEEDAIITVYGGRPPPRRRRVSNVIHGAPTHCGWGHGAHGCNGTSFPVSLYMCVCVCENVYYSRSKGQKKEGMKDGGEDNLRLRA
jgi:hypothetical protein